MLALSAWYHFDRLTTAVGSGDFASAEHHLAGLHADVRVVRWTMAPLRHLTGAPVVGHPAADVTHTLDTADHGLNAASEGLALYRLAAGGQLLHDGRIDLGVLEQMPPHTMALRTDLENSRDDLARVRGGWLPGLAGARDTGLDQLDRAIEATDTADATLRQLPAALGAQGPRTYVVATLNSGELLPSGGALLAVALLRTDNGRIDVVSRGQVSQLTNLNRRVTWTPLPNDPWQQGADSQRLANANYSPDFPTSGEEILRLYQAQFGQEPSGVITLDAAAFTAVMTVTGPVQDATYGQLTADNVIRKTMVDAYLEFDGEADARHSANDHLIDTIFTALLKSRPSTSGVRAVLDGIQSGHIQLYFRDPGLQSLLDGTGTAHTLQPFTDDALGVYTINTNASKVDVFQDRKVTQEVVLAADGSAEVTRTVELRNAPDRPCPTATDAPVTGYMSCLSRPQVIFYLPADATDVTITGGGRTEPRSGRMHEKGRMVVKYHQDLPPGTEATVVLHYRLPARPDRPGYALHWDGQPMVRTPGLTVRLTPAPGTELTGAGWRRVGDTLEATVPLTGNGYLRAVPVTAR